MLEVPHNCFFFPQQQASADTHKHTHTHSQTKHANLHSYTVSLTLLFLSLPASQTTDHCFRGGLWVSPEEFYGIVCAVGRPGSRSSAVSYVLWVGPVLGVLRYIMWVGPVLGVLRYHMCCPCLPTPVCLSLTGSPWVVCVAAKISLCSF